jgi:tetratricopeptide (TPR) repeat protein
VKYPRLSLIAVCVLLTLPAVAVGEVLTDLKAAAAKSKQAGIPLIVIALKGNDPIGQQLDMLLQSNPLAKQALSQFVLAQLSADSADWKTWTSKHKPYKDEVPIVFVLSPQGDDILQYAGTPTPDKLPKMGMLAFGRMGEFKKAAAKEEKFEKLMDDKKIVDAVAILAALPPDQKPTEQDGFFMYPPASYERLAQKRDAMVEDVSAKIEKAGENLSDSDKALQSLVSLVKIRRIYGTLPPIKEALAKLLQQVKADAEQQKLLTQAEMIDKARACEETGKNDAALNAYRAVVDKYPNTMAAKLTERRIRQLSDAAALEASSPAAFLGTRSEDADNNTSTPGKKAPTSAASLLKKASANLRMAKIYIKKKPEKAKQCLHDILDAMPNDSPEAKEAKALLDQIESQ